MRKSSPDPTNRFGELDLSRLEVGDARNSKPFSAPSRPLTHFAAGDKYQSG
jgi:hypothetical protein